MVKKDIAAGVWEMRAVTEKLTAWADKMETWLHNNPSYQEPEPAPQTTPAEAPPRKTSQPGSPKG